MDPDTARQVATIAALATIGGAAVAVVGGVVAALINRRGARRVAEETLAGQRMLAAHAAQREHRQRQVDSLAEVANQRIRRYLEIATTTDIRAPNPGRGQELLRPLTSGDEMPFADAQF